MTAFTVTVDDREGRELLANLALVAAQGNGGQAGGPGRAWGSFPSGWWGMRQRGA